MLSQFEHYFWTYVLRSAGRDIVHNRRAIFQHCIEVRNYSFLGGLAIIRIDMQRGVHALNIRTPKREERTT